MSNLLGFYVIRSKHGKCKYPIWAGVTENERIAHKQWIMDSVASHSNSELYDGLTTFEDVESDIVINTVGQIIQLSDTRFYQVDSIKGRDVVARRARYNKSGKIKDYRGSIWHGYINGQGLPWAVAKTDIVRTVLR